MSEKKNTSIFVSNLPEDITVDELDGIFSKFGIIMDDMFAAVNTPRIKIYSSSTTTASGCCEALIVFLREESAEMAIKYMDSAIIRQNIVISVEKAQFKQDSHAGSDNQAQQPAPIDPQTWKERMREMKMKLEWGEDEEETTTTTTTTETKGMESWNRILVIRGMFSSPTDLTKDPSLVLDLKEDLLMECESKCGKVASVKVFPLIGVCAVKFFAANDALKALYLMDKRYFDGRQLEAFFYDGSFSLKEKKAMSSAALRDHVNDEFDDNEEDEDERLDKFGDWLEEEDHDQDEEEEEEKVKHIM